ncbi:MAG: fumarylacetoacetate hydrolase family protein [Alphaproteobacteria bacterium]|nr:fumarylacetoacetate hydrolase family protein [Alphaproteobacteria bacterium]
MRIVAFDKNGTATLGVRDGDALVDLSIADPSLPPDVLGFLKAGKDAFAHAAATAREAGADARVALDGLTYRLPLPNPPKIICLGLNYADHAAEGGHEKPTYPSLFMRGATSLVAHNEPMIRPRCSEQLDYEAELAAVVGKRARHVSEADGLSIIAGYSIFNDGSIREYQRKTAQWTVGKNFDATGGFGPEFVTADEIPPGGKGLRIQSRLNGTVMQDANTDDMLFGVAETVAILTECMTLEPGDLLVMGTPAGVGHARTPPVWMKPGDVCEVEIETIGTLRNPVEDESPA